MKKKLLSLLTGGFVLMCSVSLAQPTLTATGVNPVYGDVYSGYTSGYISPGSSGANQTWNLASLTGSSGGTATAVAPASTTYGSSFPGSNLSWDNNSSASESFYKTSPTAFQFYGIASSTTLMSYSNPEDFLRFPFTYNDTYYDTWAVQFVNGGYTFYRTGTTTVTADGYGTLITPNGTYNNVLRIHFVQVYQDSANIGGPYIVSYNNDEYMWYKEGVHVQLATLYNLTTSAGGPYTGGSYATGSLGVENAPLLISSVNLFPNPATDQVTVDFTLTENQAVEIKLFNDLGQQVKISQSVGGVQGLNMLQLDVADLPEGIYFAQLLCKENVAATKRFVITK